MQSETVRKHKACSPNLHKQNSLPAKIINYSMTWYMAIFLGLLQGITEFLPVSSSGHLMMIQHFLQMPENMLLFNIVLHLATLAAVAAVFHKKIRSLIRQPFCRTNMCLLTATVISCGMVLLFKDLIDTAMTYRVLPFTFMLTAAMLLLTNFVAVKKSGTTKGRPSYMMSAAAGFTQGVAVVPGISRSGATIAACLLTGAGREDAAEFSFLMSIPIIIASFLYEILGNTAPIAVDIFPLLIAFAAAFISGIIAIKIMLALIKGVKLYWFSAYLTVLAVILLIVI